MEDTNGDQRGVPPKAGSIIEFSKEILILSIWAYYLQPRVPFVHQEIAFRGIMLASAGSAVTRPVLSPGLDCIHLGMERSEVSPVP